ncbi:hypothetical protein ABZV58_18080 [Nocardia sp. NPDC004654]
MTTIERSSRSATPCSAWSLESAPEAFAAFGGGTLGKIAITVA